MADDIEEPLPIEILGKNKTSTPREKDNTLSEKEKDEDVKENNNTKKEVKEKKPEKNAKNIADDTKDIKNKNPKKQTKEHEENTQITKGSKDSKERKRKISNNEKLETYDKVNSDDESGEEEETEMTKEEKEDLYNAVRNGSYMEVNNCLDKKNAEINMTWYKENLLMVAIRAGQTDMAEFLVDIGIDYNFKAKYYKLKEKDKKGKRVEYHEKSCRDLAYDLGNDHIVEVIDIKNNNIFPFVPITPRKIWQRRPPAPPLPKHLRHPPGEESEDEEDDDSDCEDLNESKINNEEVESKHTNATSYDKTHDTTLSTDVLERLNGFGKDEGYGTMSPSGSPYLAEPEKPKLLYRPTKASMAIQAHNNQYYRRCKSRSAPPLRHVNTIGSYTREKRQWEHRFNKSSEKDTISVQSLPFVSSYPSFSRSSSRPASAISSPVSQVTRILGQSSLLKAETAFSYSSTQKSTTSIPSLKINQWCHSSRNSVFERLSANSRNKSKRNSNFSVNREIIRQHRR